MCRNIRTLHNFEPPATEEEVDAAALQYVRKISGTSKPSKANQAAFDLAVDEVAAASRRLLAALVTGAPPEKLCKVVQSATRPATWAGTIRDPRSSRLSNPASDSRMSSQATRRLGSGRGSVMRPP